MPKRTQVYKCEGSPLAVEITTGVEAAGSFVFNGQELKLLDEKTADSKTEKHVPLIEGTPTGVKVVVGSVPHPMVDDHYIEWIEVINGAYVNRKYLKPGDKPEAEFYVKLQPGLIVREYCNKHGLWKG